MIFHKTMGTDLFNKCVRRYSFMAAMAAKTFASVLCLALVASACSQAPRTATNFCRQLAKEAPGISQPTVTPADIASMLDRYKRLGKVSPLAIEKDWESLIELLSVASRVKANDPESVQAVVDMAYSTEKAAVAAAKWIVETCGVDISSGLNVAPTG